ncbi:MAG TPA: hypothetical protein VIX89_14985 [Bryobacteraceae bacterium]
MEEPVPATAPPEIVEAPPAIQEETPEAEHAHDPDPDSGEGLVP